MKNVSDMKAAEAHERISSIRCLLLSEKSIMLSSILYTTEYLRQADHRLKDYAGKRAGYYYNGEIH